MGEEYFNLEHENTEDELIQAVKNNDLDEVNGLLKEGHDVNAVDVGEERTAISWAATLDRLEVAKSLCKHGADIGLLPIRMAGARCIGLPQNRSECFQLF